MRNKLSLKWCSALILVIMIGWGVRVCVCVSERERAYVCVFYWFQYEAIVSNVIWSSNHWFQKLWLNRRKTIVSVRFIERFRIGFSSVVEKSIVCCLPCMCEGQCHFLSIEMFSRYIHSHSWICIVGIFSVF